MLSLNILRKNRTNETSPEKEHAQQASQLTPPSSPKGSNTSPKVKPQPLGDPPTNIPETDVGGKFSSFASIHPTSFPLEVAPPPPISPSGLTIDPSALPPAPPIVTPPSSPRSQRSSSSHSHMQNISIVTFRIKQLVSKEKRRFAEDGFNLDLTYVTNRLIAFGYPAESFEGVYRNHYKDVYNFFEMRHPDRYRIYNLCSERTYDKEKFHNRVAEFRFDDHAPPPMGLFLPFCQDVDAWLNAHPENVAAIHCKAGKGRTGVMICAYLLYTGAWKTAHGAMEYFGAARSLKRQGVTIPSQRRFIAYFGEMCRVAKRAEQQVDEDTIADEEAVKREKELTPAEYKQIWEDAIDGRELAIRKRMFQIQPTLPQSIYLVIVGIKVSGVYGHRRIDPRIRVECGGSRRPVAYESNGLSFNVVGGDTMDGNDAGTLTRQTPRHGFFGAASLPSPRASRSSPSPAAGSAAASHCIMIDLKCDRWVVWDEVKVELRHRHGGKIGHFWFHTAFLPAAEQPELVLAKCEIDKVISDIKRGDKKYATSFSITVQFDRATDVDMQTLDAVVTSNSGSPRSGRSHSTGAVLPTSFTTSSINPLSSTSGVTMEKQRPRSKSDQNTCDMQNALTVSKYKDADGDDAAVMVPPSRLMASRKCMDLVVHVEPEK